jgi:threonine synthase
VRVRFPLRATAVVSAIVASHGFICVVDEDEILPGCDALAHLGYYVEPTSAIIWSALAHLVEKLPDPIVVILTGSGLKYG